MGKRKAMSDTYGTMEIITVARWTRKAKPMGEGN